MKTGFVIEFNVRDPNGRLLSPCVLTSEQFGKTEFNDLTEGRDPLSVDHGLEAYNREEKVFVKYDRCFVVLS